MALQVVRVPVLQDNYAWLLFDDETHECACVDPGEAAPLLAEGAKGAALAGIDTLSVLVPDDLVEQLPFPRLEDLAAEADPIVPNSSAENRERNRRIEFVLQAAP